MEEFGIGKYNVATLCWKGKPLIACTKEELNLAANYISKRISNKNMRIEKYDKKSKLFAEANPINGGEKFDRVIMRCFEQIEDLEEQELLIKWEIERR